MSDPAIAGAQSAVAILEALDAGDITAAKQLIGSCHRTQTIIALATAWLTLCEFHGDDVPAQLTGMRAAIPGQESRNG